MNTALTVLLFHEPTLLLPIMREIIVVTPLDLIISPLIWTFFHFPAY